MTLLDQEDFPEFYSELLDSQLPDLLKPDLSPYEETYGLRPGTLDTSSIRSIRADCGDDKVAISTSLTRQFLTLWVLENYMGLKISKHDTSINTGIGTYTEAVVRVPRAYNETWYSYRKLHDDSTFGYIDVPKVRLTLHTKSQRMNYSDTLGGKFSDLGRSIQWVDENHPTRFTHEIVGLFQDAILGAAVQDRSPYIERIFGGGGKHAPFRSPENFLRFHRTYKAGNYLPLVATIVNDTIDYFQRVTSGESAEPSAVLSYASRFEAQFVNWTKHHTDWTRCIDLGIPDELAATKLAVVTPFSREREAASRLVQRRLVVTETQLKVAIDHNNQCLAFCQDMDYNSYLEFKRGNLPWTESDVFSPRTLKMFAIIQPYTDCKNVARYWAYIRSSRLLRLVIREESVYPRSTLDQVYIDGPMKISLGWYCNPRTEYGSTTVPLIREVDREDPEMDPHDTALYEWFKHREGPMPRETVEDDNEIVRVVRAMPYGKGAAVVTDDINLCKRIVNETGKPVLRVPVAYYYQLVYYGDGFDAEWRETLPALCSWDIVEDTGSIAAGEERYFKDGVFYKSGIRKGCLRLTDLWDKPGRHEHWGQETTQFVAPVNWPGAYLYADRQTLGFGRVNRRIYRPQERDIAYGH